MTQSIQNKDRTYQNGIELQPISKQINTIILADSNHLNQKIIDCSKKSFTKPAPIYKNPKASNFGPIMVVLQSEAAFTTAADCKPILATHSCNTCIAIAGFEVKNKMAFLIHVAFDRELVASGDAILSNIAKFMRKRIESPIEIHLRGGVEGLSDKSVRYIKNIWMKARADLPMKLVSEDILSDDINSSKSLFIDSRNGEIGDYNPRQDPFTRKVTKDDYAAALKSPENPKITIAYDCKQK